jgi:Ca2+-transporting ATPase
VSSQSTRHPFDDDLGDGLSHEQVRERLARDGPNEWPGPRPARWADPLLAQWREPMVRLLMGASLVYALLGDVHEAIALMGFVAVSAAISVWQTRRTEAVLSALRRLSASRAWVLREGRAQRVAADALVVGDIMALHEGDRVAADAQLLRAADLQVDESLLTGESAPVMKVLAALQSGSAAKSTLAMDRVYAGARVLAGQGVARVCATGRHTEVGRIGVLVEQTELRDTPTQRQLRRWVQRLAVWGAVLSVLLAVLWVALRGGWLAGALAGISLAMSLLPQELPLVLTVFFAMGSWRLAMRKVLVRRASAIEALGAATVLMTDKTGTLTRNEMRLAVLERSDPPDAAAGDSAGGTGCDPGAERGPTHSLGPNHQTWLVDPELLACVPGVGLGAALIDAHNGGVTPAHAACEGHEVLNATGQAGVKSSSEPLARFGSPWEMLLTMATLACEQPARDPMEADWLNWVQSHRAKLPRLGRPLSLAHEYGLSAEMPAMSHVWRGIEAGDALWVATKGAPETVAALCGLGTTAPALLRAQAWAGQGMRVLAVACARLDGEPETWPACARAWPHQWLGLLAWADPLREGVREAVEQCQQAGVRVVMVTGDHPATARAIARQAGILPSTVPDGASASAPQVITGSDIADWGEDQLQRALPTCCVYARITPAQKLRLVASAQRAGEVVAMTGDGVNDAPSLKAADIGIAMGERGTEVAREVSALVLQDDAFPSIVCALRLGRLIRTNLNHAMTYLVAAHIPIALLCLAPVILGWPVLLMPVHIMFLEILIAPLCSIAFEADPEPPGLMRQAPRPADESLLTRDDLRWCALQGAAIAALVLLVFGIQLWVGSGDPQARGAAFLALVLSSLALLRVNRRWALLRSVNWRMLGIGLSALLALALIYLWPALRSFFRLDMPTTDALALALVAALVVALWPAKKDPPPLQGVGQSS